MPRSPDHPQSGSHAAAPQSGSNGASGQPAKDGSSGFTVTAPSIAVPKGGGAIRGMGEKFAANPVTGTGSMTVPIVTSPGRSGFGPQLSLSFDSGVGNRPFGFGWSLSLASVTCKTEEGLFQYFDDTDSDVFALSAAEDLVPVFSLDLDGSWIVLFGNRNLPRDIDDSQIHDQCGKECTHEDTIDDYLVRRYRPHIEGLIGHPERWRSLTSPADVFRRTLSKCNILSTYGTDPNSRIADPQHPERIYSWLICETPDDRGNGLHGRFARCGPCDELLKTAPGKLIRYDFPSSIQYSEESTSFASQSQVAYLEELVACFEDLEEHSPQVLNLPNGIPSHDVIRRVLCALRPEVFQQSFNAWIGCLIGNNGGKSHRYAPVDGKTTRGRGPQTKGLGRSIRPTHGLLS